MVGLHFTRGPVRRVADLPPAPELRTLLHLHMLERGYSYARRGFVALSLPLDEPAVDGFAAAVEEFLAAQPRRDRASELLNYRAVTGVMSRSAH
jgi:glutamate-1-semialdehyde 2,1-aminomutase